MGHDRNFKNLILDYSRQVLAFFAPRNFARGSAGAAAHSTRTAISGDMQAGEICGLVCPSPPCRRNRLKLDTNLPSLSRTQPFPCGSTKSERLLAFPRRLRALGPGRALGFTLMELVIALALIGLITLLLFSGLRLGTRAWEGVETTAEQTAGSRIARNFLARALIQVRPTRITFEGKQMTVFAGDAENLEFVAPLSEHVGTPGLYILSLTLEEDGRLVLTRRLLHPDVLEETDSIPKWTPFDGDGDISVTGPLDEDLAVGAYGSTLLLDGVEELRIGYFGIPEGQREPEWGPEWLGEPRIPLAVRVHLIAQGRTWPDMLFRLPRFGLAQQSILRDGP